MALALKRTGAVAATGASRPSLARRAVRVAAQKEDAPNKAKQLAVAGVLATSLLLSSAVAPEEAFAARSGGRVSSSGFSSRRAAPARAA